MSIKILRKNTFQLKNTPLQKSLFAKEESPIILIEFRRDKLILNEEAIEILKNINENLIIVSIFGKERTGKSYLMNLLLNPEENSKITKGFKISSQQNSSVKGIWLWNTPIPKPNSKDKIIFIDSEVINSDNIYEQVSGSKLLALLLLISTFFIYNTMGDIDSDSLNDLELLIHLGDSIGINENVNKDKLISEICPKFIWAMRDFNLKKLSPKNKKKMTSDDYMEKCLKERFDGEHKNEINMIKENFIKYFKKRECITLPRPVQEEKDLVMLKKKQVNELEDDFINEFLKLKKKIYNLSKGKIIKGKKLNGPTVAYLISQFIKIINDENIPNINEIIKQMVIFDIDNSYNQAKNYYKEKLEKLKNNEVDLDIKEIYSIKYEAIKEYMSILEKYSDITKNNLYLNEYNMKKEKLVKDIEKSISQELSVLLLNNSNEQLFNDKDKVSNIGFKKSTELIEDYLNDLCEIKINSDDAVINDKDFDLFIKKDIDKTKNIIDLIVKNEELYSDNDSNSSNEEKLKNKELNINTEKGKDYDYEALKKELKNTEKLALELIGKFTKLVEKRDKFRKSNLKPKTFHGRHSLKVFSSKLVNNYFKEENICEIASEEHPPERCNCKMDSFNNCNIL